VLDDLDVALASDEVGALGHAVEADTRDGHPIGSYCVASCGGDVGGRERPVLDFPFGDGAGAVLVLGDLAGVGVELGVFVDVDTDEGGGQPESYVACGVCNGEFGSLGAVHPVTLTTRVPAQRRVLARDGYRAEPCSGGSPCGPRSVR